MSIRSSSLLSFITAVTATCMLSMPLSAQQSGREDQERFATITAKLKDMQGAAKQRVSILKEEYKAGTVGFPKLHQAQHDLLEIELKLANSSAERMNVLSRQLELAKDAEALMAAEYKKRAASQLDVLQAQIARMKIELAMLEDVAPLHSGGVPADPVPPRAVKEDARDSNRTAALRDLQFHRTAASLVRLLKLNNHKTSDIEKLGHPTNSAGITDIATIHSAGDSYVAVVARRYPPEVTYPFGEHGIGVGFLFDRDGNLEAHFGGELGPDGVNGDEVQFTTLGKRSICPSGDQVRGVVRRLGRTTTRCPDLHRRFAGRTPGARTTPRPLRNLAPLCRGCTSNSNLR